ncbi:hypothetical protein F7725_007042 [Dissostichus mawsoni]|uniref:Uncharacterized protein n=1 Tax=Dissostichus mawsoni TaxID=36200 RepID=A0A7J5XVM4_DISMA|nr:hypothetical protein F7725_007042 [Dissostichus mawsoni]
MDEDRARTEEVPILQEACATRASEGDNTVGFGARAKDTWKQIWDSRADGYAAFILGVKCIINSKMYNLEQYILKQQRAESCPPPAEGCIASATSTLTSSTPALPCPAPPVPLAAHQPAASVPGYSQDVAHWNCSHQQKIWMKVEFES